MLRCVICLLWKPTKATHKRELLRCVAVIAGRWVGGGGVGTKILACGAPRAFPGCHFLGQNYTPRQTGNRPGAVPQTSVVCSHNSPHVPLFVYLCAFVSLFSTTGFECCIICLACVAIEKDDVIDPFAESNPFNRVQSVSGCSQP